MQQNQTIDNKIIIRQIGRSGSPPPFNGGGMAPAASLYWILVDTRWYHWLGLQSRVKEAIDCAHQFTADEWVEALSDDLELWEP